MASRTDDIASLRIWQDALRKEMRSLSTARPATFSLNPHSLKPVAGKIGARSTRREEAAAAGDATASLAATRRAEDVRALKDKLARSSRTPTDVYPRPVTAAQEIGWFVATQGAPTAAAAALSPDATSHGGTAKLTGIDEWPRATHAQSAEVAYAKVYYETFRCGPFQKTQTVAR